MPDKWYRQHMFVLPPTHSLLYTYTLIQKDYKGDSKSTEPHKFINSPHPPALPRSQDSDSMKGIKVKDEEKLRGHNMDGGKPQRFRFLYLSTQETSWEVYFLPANLGYEASLSDLDSLVQLLLYPNGLAEAKSRTDSFIGQ